ncbi:MAG TPA: hypothetical protein ENJ90_06145 [Devosia sp.]|nr:hypothetical protein [Devosia sp.]
MVQSKHETVYFGDKEKLYRDVLERAYAELRVGEQALNLAQLPPFQAIEKFILFSFDFLLKHPYFVPLLNDENLHKARHIKSLNAWHNYMCSCATRLVAHWSAD